MIRLRFEGEIVYWRGPAPYFFIPVPEEPSRELKSASARLTYGWGVIPVRARIGQTEWKTSLFPKNGRYLVPVRLSVQKAENLNIGERVVVELEAG